MFALLKLVPGKVWLWLGIALAIAGLLAHDHIGWQKAKARNIEISKLKITIEAEREQRKKSDASAKRYAKRIQASRGPRSPAPQLMCKLPARVSTAPTTSGTNAAPSTDNGGVLAEVDLGPRLDVSYGACEENLIKLEELQRWVLER